MLCEIVGFIIKLHTYTQCISIIFTPLHSLMPLPLPLIPSTFMPFLFYLFVTKLVSLRLFTGIWASHQWLYCWRKCLPFRWGELLLVWGFVMFFAIIVVVVAFKIWWDLTMYLWNSLCRPGWSWTQSDPPVSVSQLLGLKMCTTTTNLKRALKSSYQEIMYHLGLLIDLHPRKNKFSVISEEEESFTNYGGSQSNKVGPHPLKEWKRKAVSSLTIPPQSPHSRVI